MENYKYTKTPILHSIDVSFAWEISLGTPAGAYALTKLEFVIILKSRSTLFLDVPKAPHYNCIRDQQDL